MFFRHVTAWNKLWTQNLFCRYFATRHLNSSLQSKKMYLVISLAEIQDFCYGCTKGLHMQNAVMLPSYDQDLFVSFDSSVCTVHVLWYICHLIGCRFTIHFQFCCCAVLILSCNTSAGRIAVSGAPMHVMLCGNVAWYCVCACRCMCVCLYFWYIITFVCYISICSIMEERVKRASGKTLQGGTISIYKVNYLHLQFCFKLSVQL